MPCPLRCPIPTGTIQFEADRGDARMRLDQVIVRRVTSVSRLTRSAAQRWIEAGAVQVDGRVMSRPSSRVREGAAISLLLPDTAVPRARPEAEDRALSVLFEDDHLLVLDKPPGMVVHPSYKQLSGTLLNAVLWRVRARTGVRPGILTRLDKDTSGLVVIALSPDVHATMQRNATAGGILKEYLAIVQGTPSPPAGRIQLPLARDPLDRRRVVVAEGGAGSETGYAVMTALASGRSVVRCELVTGRTHQIRVHLSARGWPIVGDPLYGVADPVMARQALHAWRITLPHPITGAELRVEAPLPADMQELIER